MFSRPDDQTAAVATPPRASRKLATKIHLIPVMDSSPATRFPHIVNPFEQHLAERLHLPVICSPSLFQRPSTPQKNSTQFEWTIEDVSSLAPANLEASELQFQTSHDPEVEAKAQAAISSYFKENDVVPSPVSCALRSQKIILCRESSLNMSFATHTGGSVGKKRQTRDGSSQTVLTLPPVLPKDLEQLLLPFFTYSQVSDASVFILLLLDLNSNMFSLPCRINNKVPLLTVIPTTRLVMPPCAGNCLTSPWGTAPRMRTSTTLWATLTCRR